MFWLTTNEKVRLFKLINSTTDNGKTTLKTASAFIFGSSKKVKENFCETDTKGNGKTGKETAMEPSITPTEPNMRENGSII
jgi:hypothetical protein